MNVPVIAFAGWSGSGKTTLIERLIPALIQKGRERHGRPLRVAVIKHAGHRANIVRNEDGEWTDAEGTDTWRFRKAGADPVIFCGPEDPDLQTALKLAENGGMPDLLLVEGFKGAGLPQSGICRKANGKGWTADPESFLAIVTDLPEETQAVPRFGPDEIDKIADFILKAVEL